MTVTFLSRLLRTSVFTMLLCHAAGAQEPESVAGPEASAELVRIITEQNALIRQLGLRIEQLEARLDRIDGDSTPPDPGAATGPPPSAVTEEQLLTLTEEELREQERLVRAAFQSTLVERGGLLLPPGTFDVEPSLTYIHSSAENIVIDGFTILPVLVVGDIVSENVQRNLTQLATTIRVGLPWHSQLDIRLPYSHQSERRFSADNEESSSRSSGLGDVTIGFSRQITAGGRWPDLLASLRWKSSTGASPFDVLERGVPSVGTGYRSLNVALTGVRVVDPIVYFGTISFSHNAAHRESIGVIDPGNSFGLSLGMAIALNIRGSLSLSYDQQYTRRTRLDGEDVPGSYLTTGMFSIGGSFAVSDSRALDLSIAAGLTRDSPDIQVSASLPFRFRR